MDILETMARRTSSRRFSDQPVDPELRAQVLAAGEHAEALTPAPVRFHLCDGAALDQEVKGLVGDYGKVIHAPHYVVVTARESPGYLVDAGYRLEQLILDATQRGLGTCWVGGFFREPSLRRALGLEDAERVVALTPLGWAPEKRGLVEGVMRLAVRSDGRKGVDELFSWQQAGTPVPAAWQHHPRTAALLECTRRAPSWANKQPWRFILLVDGVLLYKETRQDKEGKDYHLVDCGIAMAHLHLAARALGAAGHWQLSRAEIPGAPRAEPVARYTFDGGAPWPAQTP